MGTASSKDTLQTEKKTVNTATLPENKLPIAFSNNTLMSDNLDLVIVLVQQAEAAQRNNNLEEAISLRTDALGILLDEVRRSEEGSQRQKGLIKESEKLLTETEALKTRLRPRPPVPSTNSTHVQPRNSSKPTVGMLGAPKGSKLPNCPTQLRKNNTIVPPQAPPTNIPPTSQNFAAQATKTRTELEQRILDELLEDASAVRWSDVVGLEYAKQTLQEAVILPSIHPELFSGLRSPPKGVLLFGPPGTGKTLLAKAVASESGYKFFSISASSLTSKWVGEGEKLVRAMFALAREMQPSVIFMDEIDSVLSKRSENEHEASRRIKTEFMIQLDGACSHSDDKLLVIGATNLPHELDDAVLRRLSKRVYVPLPDASARSALLLQLLPPSGSIRVSLTSSDRSHIINRSENYSCSDMVALCKEASMGPVRELLLTGSVVNATPESVRGVSIADFDAAFRKVRPSVSPQSLQHFAEWERDNT